MKSLILLFWIFFGLCLYAQDYDNYIIDNSDWELMKKHKVKKCRAYKEIYTNEVLSTEQFLSDLYIFNEQGLTLEEFNFHETDTSTKNYWYLKAQYNDEGFVVSEQWFYFDFNDIDSSFYTHDDQGRIKLEVVKYYEEGQLEYKDSLLHKYYPDSMVQIDLFTNEISTYRTEHGDTIIYYYGHNKSQYVRIKLKSTDEHSITYYPKENKTIESFYEYDRKGNKISVKSFVNKIPSTEYYYTYERGLLTKIISIDVEKKERVVTVYQYENF